MHLVLTVTLQDFRNVSLLSVQAAHEVKKALTKCIFNEHKSKMNIAIHIQTAETHCNV